MSDAEDVTRANRGPAGHEEAGKTSHSLHGCVILVVEDDQDSRDVLHYLVERAGAKALVTTGGKEALKLLQTATVHLILCDLMMPGMDGFEFMQRLKQDPKLSRIPVVAVTAFGTVADFRLTLEAGFAGHMVKPILFQTLDAELRRILT
jgi:two-component system, chemotaxis family, CheB/CheR fusion protein